MPFEETRLAAFVARHQDTAAASLRFTFKPLRGGLRSAAVVRVSAEFEDRASGRRNHWAFVVKRLDGVDRREASIYSRVLESFGWQGSPRLLGIESVQPDTICLYMEYVTRSQSWPWANSDSSALTLRTLAELHRADVWTLLAEVAPHWNYELELLESARSTQEMYEHVVQQEEMAGLRRYRTALHRVVAGLPALRQQLLHGGPLPVTFIHGDAHPGNALIVSGPDRHQAVLLDWGRARAGSPLEDVASWLQSLGYWEPEARRRHDTLFRRYLEARGISSELTRSLRDHYWLAGMCNVLSGSLRYHLWVAAGGTEAPSMARTESVGAARDQLRVLRRADIVWRSLME